MTVSTFESLPIDILFEIFGYLSPVNILRSFSYLNQRLSRFVIYKYMWHISIGDSTMSFSMFNDICQNVLKLIGSRVVSLRVILSNTIGGWSLVSSSFGYHQTTLLRRLHLIDIKPHEFDKLLKNHLIKQLHTLLVDVAPGNLFHRLEFEGIYLTKVCLQLPFLSIYRLPFNVCHRNVNQLEKHSEIPMISLPNLSNTIHLRTLSIGMNTSFFIKRLLSRIPFIENLSLGVNDKVVNKCDRLNTNTISVTNNIQLVNLCRLRIHCANSISFHRAIALFSSVFGQLSHFSLKLEAYTSTFEPWMISGNTIQQFCIDRLTPSATYNLNLLFNIKNDSETKIIFNSFAKASFTNRQHPKVFIQERDDLYVGHNYHCFLVYTVPYTHGVISTHMLTSDLQRSCQKLVNPLNLFPRANELFINAFIGKSCHADLGDWKSSLSALVPWTQLTRITVDDGDVISAAELEAILKRASNVHTLEIYDCDTLSSAILSNTDYLGARVNEQIRSFTTNDCTWTLYNAQNFCTSLSNRLFNLKNISFNINNSSGAWTWIPPCITDDENESTKHIVDHLQELVSLQIHFVQWHLSDTPCFPHLIRQHLHQRPLSRPYRLQYSSNKLHMWF